MTAEKSDQMMVRSLLNGKGMTTAAAAAKFVCRTVVLKLKQKGQF